MEEYDLYDVLADLGYGLRPMKRPERAHAFAYKNARWLRAMPENTAHTVTAIANQFALAGTDGLENREIFRIPDVVRAGGMAALKSYGEPATVLKETKERMFAT
jgi:type I restriction enzyme R subunit